MDSSPPPYAICPDCKQDIRESDPHCANAPNTALLGPQADASACTLCVAPATQTVRVRWHCRARPKYRDRQMANPLHSVDHWTWLDFGACAACAAHTVAADVVVIGWDWWDAVDGLPTPPAPPQTFTAFYCLTHDQGAVVVEALDELPTAVQPCGAIPAGECVYANHGQIEVLAGEARATSFDLGRDYGRHAGGWESAYYAQEVYALSGESVSAPPALVDLFDSI